ncbi:MAG: hypothetical protein ABIA62_06340 [Candidatus Woesearchaeota archaeon]
MKGTRYNILVKFSQQQKINAHFQDNQMLDAMNILHFSESFSYGRSHFLQI